MARRKSAAPASHVARDALDAPSATIPKESVSVATVETGFAEAHMGFAEPLEIFEAAARPAGRGADSAVATRAIDPTEAGHKSTLSTLVFRATPLERIDMIRRGIAAAEAKRLLDDMGIGQGVGFRALSLATATVNKKAKQGDRLSPEESERVVGFAKLVGQVEAMVEESGDPTGFDAGAWLARWLTEPLPAFGGMRPADLMDTMEGQGMVSTVLGQMQSGAYA